jgi:hypothetical protein
MALTNVRENVFGRKYYGQLAKWRLAGNPRSEPRYYIYGEVELLRDKPCTPVKFRETFFGGDD